MINIQTNNLSKIYGAKKALDNVSIEFNSKQIHAVVGENGAGKSTLFKLIAKYLNASNGQIFTASEAVIKEEINISDVGFVMQESSLIPEFSIIENFALAYKSFGVINWTKLTTEINDLLAMHKLSINPERPASFYDINTLQMLEVIRLLWLGKKIILLDEPTANLNSSQSQDLFTILQSICNDHTIIFSTHKITEAYNYANYIHVLRKGKHIKSIKQDELINEEEIIQHMFTSKVESTKVSTQQLSKQVKNVLEVNDLIISNKYHEKINLNLQEKEVVAIIGLAENGQKELFDCICGLAEFMSGEILIDNQKINTSKNLYLQGLARFPQTAVNNSALMEMNLAQNLFTHKHPKNKIKFTYLLNWFKMHKLTNSVIAAEGLATNNSYASFNWLSGGNQRKLLIARELQDQPKVFIAHNLEAGLDLKAINKVIKQINELQNTGTAILIFAEDLDFVTKIASRVIYISDGKLNNLNFRNWREEYSQKITNLELQNLI